METTLRVFVAFCGSVTSLDIAICLSDISFSFNLLDEVALGNAQAMGAVTSLLKEYATANELDWSNLNPDQQISQYRTGLTEQRSQLIAARSEIERLALANNPFGSGTGAGTGSGSGTGS